MTTAQGRGPAGSAWYTQHPALLGHLNNQTTRGQRPCSTRT
jgi:hypothetical protein